MSKESVSERANQTSDELDLVASGSSGQWSVFIDESHTGPDKWFAQIKGPSIYFSFEIPSAKTVDQVLKLLHAPTVSPSDSSVGSKKRNDSLTIGKNNRLPVKLIRDSEYTDRFFLVLGTTNSSLVRYSLEGSDLGKLIEALRQARAELASEGLLS